ncbi:MAG TPA: tetratricopeptide repeat protein, partial [Firmicutes bacterium]|nr:tetratricopeptide repeat protein [Bacillota bacterium]
RWHFLEDYIQVADHVETGLVPNFPLPYQLPDLDLKEGLDAKSVADGRLKMLLLSRLFDPEEDDDFKHRIVLILCEAPEDWSIEFGKAILQSNFAPMPWKFAAGQALTERGVFKKGKPIPILVDGETREVYLETKGINFATPEQRERLEEARSHFFAGEYEKALELVQEDFAGEDVTIESLELLAKIHVRLGEGDKAVEIAELFAKMAPVLESPVLLLIAAGIHLLVGDAKSAKEQFAKVEKYDLSPEIFQYYDTIQSILAADYFSQAKPPAGGSSKKKAEKDLPAESEIIPRALPADRQYHWSYEEVDQMGTEEIAAYLLGLGIDFNLKEFIQATTVELSAEDLAEGWIDDYCLEIAGYNEDFPWFAAWVLWNRLAEKGNFCSEELDELLMKGYDLVKDGRITAGCDVWLEVWEAMKYKIRETGRPLAYLAKQYMGTFFVSNFVQDLLSNLRQAARIEPIYQQKRLDFAQELLSLAPIDESWDEESLIHNFKRAVAESYVRLGELKRAEQEFLKLVQDHPKNFWSYIACGDFYEHGGGNNLEKAREFYLKAAQLTAGTPDHEITSERLNYLENLTKKRK